MKEYYVNASDVKVGDYYLMATGDYKVTKVETGTDLEGPYAEVTFDYYGGSNHFRVAPHRQIYIGRK